MDDRGHGKSQYRRGRPVLGRRGGGLGRMLPHGLGLGRLRHPVGPQTARSRRCLGPALAGRRGERDGADDHLRRSAVPVQSHLAARGSTPSLPTMLPKISRTSRCPTSGRCMRCWRRKPGDRMELPGVDTVRAVFLSLDGKMAKVGDMSWTEPTDALPFALAEAQPAASNFMGKLYAENIPGGSATIGTPGARLEDCVGREPSPTSGSGSPTAPGRKRAGTTRSRSSRPTRRPTMSARRSPAAIRRWRWASGGRGA